MRIKLTGFHRKLPDNKIVVYCAAFCVVLALMVANLGIAIFLTALPAWIASLVLPYTFGEVLKVLVFGCILLSASTNIDFN